MNVMMLAAEGWMWQPAITPLKIVALAAALLVLAVLAYVHVLKLAPFRSVVLLVMRVLVIGGLALLLMGPSVMPEAATAPGRGKLTILLDTSGSMLTDDVAGQTRLSHAIGRWLSPEKLASLREDFDLRLIGFNEQARSLTQDALRRPAEQLASGMATRYADVLRQQLLETQAGDDAQTMLVIGDGHDTDQTPLQPVVTLANSRNVRLYTVAVGSSDVPRDLAVVALTRQEYLMTDEPGQVVVTVYQTGADQESVTLRLRGQGVDERQTVKFAGRASARAEFTVKPGKPGTYEFQAAAEPLGGETIVDNNEQTVFVEVVAKRIRVLILEGEPYWDTKFIAQALRADPRIELTNITQVTDNKRESIVTRNRPDLVSTPRSAEQWAAYDVVILGRGMENMLDAEAIVGLDRSISNGAGSLVFARGRAYNPDTPEGRLIGAEFARLEPVVWAAGMEHVPEHLSTQLTPDGMAHPSFAFPGLPGGPQQVLAALPPPQSVPMIEGLKPATRVLAVVGSGPAVSAQSPPVAVTMNYGAGKVFALLGEGLWKWGLLPPRLAQYKGAHNVFWTQTVRWASMGGDFQPGQDISLVLGRTSVRASDPLNFDVSLKAPAPLGFSPSLTVTDPQGGHHKVALTPVPGTQMRYTGTFEPHTGGTWSASLDAPPLSPASQTRKFTVYDINVERLRTDARPHLLRDLAEQTGGYFFTADQDVNLAQVLQRQRQAEVVPPRPRYVWDQTWIMLLLFTWMGLEWIGRRGSGWL